MESPVVLDKPPEYHGSDDRGFPFEEEEGSGAWSDLAARYPDIAARLRHHPSAANWARKRRPSSQDADEFGDNFSNFDRFPFDDIPPEFREHFPSHFNRRFGQREERNPQTQSPQSPQPQTSQSPPKQQTTATQTEQDPPEPSQPQHTPIPQYGLRNTVDLGQKSAADPSLVDADERNQRSVSAPPESPNNVPKMSAQNHQEPPHAEQTTQGKVRNIPIFVEGREKPVINETLDGATHFADAKPTYTHHHPQQTPLDSSYFTEDAAPMYTQPPNFSKSYGTPYSKQFRQGGQPLSQDKVYPQTYARGASPARSQSPKPQEIKIPVHHTTPRPQARPEQPRPQPKPQQQHQPPPQQQHQPPPQQQHQPPPQQQYARGASPARSQPSKPQEIKIPVHSTTPRPEQPPPKQPTPPPTAKPQPPDPITQILAIQTDVLNLMTDVEKFTGSKKDKRYIYLDEMLTRNLIKLDTIETEGKENIRNARKEAIRCIQKCIAVLEAKADGQKASESQQNQEQGDEEINAEGQTEEKTQNGEVDMKETPKDEARAEQPAENEQMPEEPSLAANKDAPQAADTRPDETEAKPEGVDKKPKKVTKCGKSDKSKDKSAEQHKKVDDMQVDPKGENKSEPTQMDVDEGAPSQ